MVNSTMSNSDRTSKPFGSPSNKLCFIPLQIQTPFLLLKPCRQLSRNKENLGVTEGVYVPLCDQWKNSSIL